MEILPWVLVSAATAAGDGDDTMIRRRSPLSAVDDRLLGRNASFTPCSGRVRIAVDVPQAGVSRVSRRRRGRSGAF